MQCERKKKCVLLHHPSWGELLILLSKKKERETGPSLISKGLALLIEGPPLLRKGGGGGRFPVDWGGEKKRRPGADENLTYLSRKKGGSEELSIQSRGKEINDVGCRE